MSNDPLDKMAENARQVGLDYEPAQQEPFGYFKAEPFGWTDCAESDEGAVALYERPQPAQRTWVGLTDEEVKAIFDSVPTASCQSYAHWRSLVALAIETKLREKNT